MKGDFSRITFDPAKHFLRVLMQQGRVQLDSDWNEQTAILLHYLQTLVKDIVGPYAGPQGDEYGFEIKNPNNGNFHIGKGRYYVDGILVENRDDVAYRAVSGPASESTPIPTQPGLPGASSLEDGRYLVYLDVWERHITYIQDGDIREKALRGPDTTTRSKVVWQVKVLELNTYEYCNNGAEELNDKLAVVSQVCLSARAKQEKAPKDPCLTAPESRYRGAENQLYRVEIHSVGDELTDKPTFKWSRDNGSIVFPVKTVEVDLSSSVTTVELEDLGRDSDRGLSVGDWVEIVDDDYTLRNEIKPLLQVYSVDRIEMKVTLTGEADISSDPTKHPLLRRWDHKKGGEMGSDGALVIAEDWIKLEDGIEVRFDIKDEDSVRSGDYWLIPARTATGDVEWPKQVDENGQPRKDPKGYFIPESLPPQGVLHHFAPLAIINVTDSDLDIVNDCRCDFAPLSNACDYTYYGRLGIGTDLLCPEENLNQ